MTEDEIFGWNNQLDGHDFEQALGVSDRQARPGTLQSMGLQRVRYD